YDIGADAGTRVCARRDVGALATRGAARGRVAQISAAPHAGKVRPEHRADCVRPPRRRVRQAHRRIHLAERYQPLIAAAVLAGFFLLATIVAVFCLVLSRCRTIEQAELALAARKQAAWFDPKLLAGAIQASGGSAGAGSFRSWRWEFSRSASE